MLQPVATDAPAACRQRLQQELDRVNYALAKADRVSISVGVTLAEPVLPLDLDLLIARADHADVRGKAHANDDARGVARAAAPFYGQLAATVAVSM